MDLQQRIDLAVFLGKYILEDSGDWRAAKENAYQQNNWFIPQFVNMATTQIATQFLADDNIRGWVAHYHIDDNIQTREVGIIMAGNIPLVGFHDFLCVFIAGHKARIKLSSKDAVLLKHLISVMIAKNADVNLVVSFEEMLRDCDAYIATGSNNSGRYFQLYFGKYPSIIRRNRTSVAVLTGEESAEELSLLADDIHLYFGLGCRNVTKILVPEAYDFVPLLQAFKPYAFFGEHHKYKNNYDYQLSILLLNAVYYMSSDSTLLVENVLIFSPIAQVNYGFVKATTVAEITENTDVQCIVGQNFLPFGKAQQPGLFDYADGVDTMAFLLSLS